MSASTTATLIVMPCLNEADHVGDAVGSLLEDPPEAGPRPILIAVDNGSTDSTRAAFESLPDDLASRVIVVDEPTRGHVPARHRGALAAAEWADAEGFDLSAVVLVQADADTHYSRGYAKAMTDAVRASPTTSCIAEAHTGWPTDFTATFPCVFGALTPLDAPIEARHGWAGTDVLVDDKACAYNLADYFAWGGHRREYFQDGEEILGETTRLMISARACGAERVEVASVTATHSQRRMLEDAAQLLATTGFPYATRRVFPDDGPIGLAEIESSLEQNDLDLFRRICAMRSRHLLAFYAFLPAHVARTVRGRRPVDPLVAGVLDALPVRSVDDAALRPGLLVSDVLTMVWASWTGETSAAGTWWTPPA